MSVTATAGVCTDDIYEVNNAAWEAAPIAMGSYTGLASCFDEDWYEINLTAGQTLTAEILFDHDEGDLDLDLFNSVGSTIASSNSIDDNEEIVHTVSSTGIYWNR